jgi:hypothetical protein
MKRTFFVLLAALHLIAAAPAARAEIEIPTCYPCGR